MKYLIFNAKYSENVGDGIVAETTEYVFKQKHPNATIETLDIGGKQHYGDHGIKVPYAWKKRFNDCLETLPKIISNAIQYTVSTYKLQKDIAPLWETKIKEADLILIGGGQLIADTDLYFPIRIAFITKLAKKYQVPIAFHAVGISNPYHWSWGGKSLFKRIFSYKKIAPSTVRDSLSAQYFSTLSGTEVTITPDTGIYAKDTYNIPHTPQNSIGIGIIHPEEVLSHTHTSDRKVTPTLDNYMALAEAIIASGRNVEFFTNGAQKDYAYLCALKKIYPPQKSVSFAKKPHTAKDLVHLISQYDQVIASRLHACIVATSYQIPIIGMAWDPKVQYFFETQSLSSRMIYKWDINEIIKNIL